MQEVATLSKLGARIGITLISGYLVLSVSAIFLSGKLASSLGDDVRDLYLEWFPALNGKYHSLIDHGYPSAAETYLAFSIIHISILILSLVGLHIIFYNKKIIMNYRVILFFIIFTIYFFNNIFLRNFIDYEDDRFFYNYRIHTGRFNYFYDIIAGSSLILFSVGLVCALRGLIGNFRGSSQ